MDEKGLQTLLRFFKCLANENRLKLLGLLADQERSVEELSALLDLKEPTVSHHLAKDVEGLAQPTARESGSGHCPQ